MNTPENLPNTNPDSTSDLTSASSSSSSPSGQEPGSSLGNKAAIAIAVVFTMLISAGAAYLVFKPDSLPKISATAVQNCNGVSLDNCIVETGLAIARQSTPAEGLAAINLALQAKPELQQGCHTIAHKVGQGFFTEYGDDAMVSGNAWCSYGYYHGLLQSYAASEGLDKLVAYGNRLCSTVESKITQDCMHGIGHAAYAVTQDLSPSFAVCSTMSGDNALSCADAVIMEDIFRTNTGRMYTAYTPEDCMALKNSDVILGCAKALAAEQAKLVLSAEESCGKYTPDARDWCLNGFGMALAGNMLSNQPNGWSDSQISSCSDAGGWCAIGFGTIAFNYLIDVNAAQAICKQYMLGAAYKPCVDEIDNQKLKEPLSK